MAGFRYYIYYNFHNNFGQIEHKHQKIPSPSPSPKSSEWNQSLDYDLWVRLPLSSLEF